MQIPQWKKLNLMMNLKDKEQGKITTSAVKLI